MSVESTEQQTTKSNTPAVLNGSITNLVMVLLH